MELRSGNTYTWTAAAAVGLEAKEIEAQVLPPGGDGDSSTGDESAIVFVQDRAAPDGDGREVGRQNIVGGGRNEEHVAKRRRGPKATVHFESQGKVADCFDFCWLAVHHDSLIWCCFAVEHVLCQVFAHDVAATSTI